MSKDFVEEAKRERGITLRENSALLLEASEKGEVLPEFKGIEEKYNTNIALMLQSYLAKWVRGHIELKDESDRG